MARSLTLSLKVAGADAAVASAKSWQVLESLLPAKEAVETIQSLADVVLLDIGSHTTMRANDVLVRLEPPVEYLRRLVAVAARHVELGLIRIEYRHGWPILSSLCGSKTIAEAGGVTSAPRGGRA